MPQQDIILPAGWDGYGSPAMPVSYILSRLWNAQANQPETGGVDAALALLAPLASPTFTGDPRAPTPSAADNDTSIATTAFVKTTMATGTPMPAGVVGDGVVDDSNALEAAMQAAANAGRCLFLPAGRYRITRGLTVTLRSDTANVSARVGGFGIRGENMYTSVIMNEAAAYAITIPNSGEAATFDDFSIYTLTGGGINLDFEGGNQSFRRVFFNGCGAGFWALKIDDGYVIDIQHCRFWHTSTGFQGGAIQAISGHSLNIDRTFVSRQSKDGTIIYINDYKNVAIGNLTLESNTAGRAGPFTDQMMIEIANFSTNMRIGDLHLEGQFNYGIGNRTGDKIRHLHITTLFVWQKDTNGWGAKNFQVIKAQANDKITVESLYVKVDNTIAAPDAGFTNLLDDVGDSVLVGDYEVTGTNHATRPLKTNPRGCWWASAPDIVSGFQFAGSATTAPSATLQLTAFGTYTLHVNLTKSDFNHSIASEFFVAWDSGRANNYAFIEQRGSRVRKGSNLTDVDLTKSITAGGLITISAVASPAGNYTLDYSLARRARLR